MGECDRCWVLAQWAALAAGTSRAEEYLLLLERHQDEGDWHHQAAPAPAVKPDHPALDRAEMTLLASGYTPNEDLVDASEWSARSVAEIVLSVLEEE